MTGHIYRSIDGGATWSLSTTTAGMYKMIVAKSNPQTVYANDGRELIRSTDGGVTWTALSMEVGSFDFAVDPTNDQVVYTQLLRTFPDVKKSTDGGVTSVPMNAGLPPALSYSGIGISPNNPKLLYLSAWDSGDIYWSTDGGATWSLRGTIPLTIPGSDRVFQFQINPLNGYIFAIGDGISRSTDGGVTWSKFLDGRDNPYGMSSGPVLAFDPVNANIIYGNSVNGPVRSSDGGLTWTSIAGALTTVQKSNAPSIAFNNNTLYLGTQGQGLFKATIPGSVTPCPTTPPPPVVSPPTLPPVFMGPPATSKPAFPWTISGTPFASQPDFDSAVALGAFGGQAVRINGFEVLAGNPPGIDGTAP
jgi:photosystem II stability/assembly factor-like uncharacterized protein